MSATSSSSQRPKQDEEDIAAINGAIERMRAFTPTDPYILTIPQDVEPRYHHLYKYQATQWLDHTPFKPQEHESTQYQTFIYHEPGRDMFMLHNSQPGESKTNGNKSGVATGANTPSGNSAPKKKISLSAYKMKQSAAATPDRKESEQQAAKQPAVKGPIERIKADEEVLAAVESGEDPILTSPPKEEKKDLKRKRDATSTKEEAAVNGEKEAENPKEEDVEPPKKARRTSPSPIPTQELAQTKNARKGVEEPPANTNKQDSPIPNSSKDSILPPKLSPPPADPVKSQLPPKLSPVTGSSSHLPPRLSPTLPSNIAATLKARAHYRSASRSSDLPGSRSASKDPATRHLTPPPKSVPRNGFRANSGSPAVRSDVEDRGRPRTSRTREINSSDPDTEASEEIVVSKGVEKRKSEQRQRSSSSEPQLLVKLKFRKLKRQYASKISGLQRSSVQSSLPERDGEEGVAVEEKEAKRPSKASDARQRDQRDTNAKGVAQKVKPNGVTKNDSSKNGVHMERKRSRSDDSDLDETPPKRNKAAPDSAGSKSRDPSTPAAQRPPSQPLPGTMRKEVLSASAMKREHSNDSTFGGSHTQSQTSPSIQGSLTSQPNENSQAPTATTTALEKAWRAEGRRLQKLAKDLKQAATDHTNLANNSQNNPSKLQDQKLAAVKSLEAFLSFLLTFICDDEARLASNPKLSPTLKTWRTLSGFYAFSKQHCEPFPHLYGLACALIMVSTARILELTTQQRRSSSETTAPNNTAGAGSSPDSSYNNLLDIAAQMRRAANEADTKLDLDALQTAFPRAWAGKAKGVLEKDVLEVGSGFKGPYKLPIGVHTSPLRAARAAYAVLEEWIQKEGGGMGGYGMKLKL